MAPPSTTRKTSFKDRVKEGKEGGGAMEKYVEGRESGKAAPPGGGRGEGESARKETVGDLERARERMFGKYMAEIEKWREEMKEERRLWEQERKRERAEWEMERKILESRLRELEMREERRERENKKKNIVIRGGQWKEGEGEKEVEEFIKENLKVEVEVKEAWKIRMKNGGEEIVVAKLGNWEDKRTVMRKKKELKAGIYIEDDLTREEREVQRKLRMIARENREKGKMATVRYKKICIEHLWYNWNEREGGLERAVERGKA